MAIGRLSRVVYREEAWVDRVELDQDIELRKKAGPSSIKLEPATDYALFSETLEVRSPCSCLCCSCLCSSSPHLKVADSSFHSVVPAWSAEFLLDAYSPDAHWDSRVAVPESVPAGSLTADAEPAALDDCFLVAPDGSLVRQDAVRPRGCFPERPAVGLHYDYFPDDCFLLRADCSPVPLDEA